MTIGKLNVDDNPNTAFKFQIRGIPALLLFKGGQVVESGRRPRAEGRPQEGHRQAPLSADVAHTRNVIIIGSARPA